MTETKHLPDIADVRAALMDDLAGFISSLDAALAEVQEAVNAARQGLAEGNLPSIESFSGPSERVLRLTACAQFARSAALDIAQMRAEHLGNVVQVAAIRRQAEHVIHRTSKAVAR